MGWQIVDAFGFEDLRIGDRRVDVRSKFGEFRAFLKGPNKHEADLFDEAGVVAYYGSGGEVDLIEITSPADPSLAGVSLIGVSPADLARQLGEQEIEIRMSSNPADEGGMILGWNIGLWIPRSKVEAISFTGRLIDEDLSARICCPARTS